MYATTGTGGRAQALPIHGILSLTPGDYVEVWIENATDDTNLTVEALNVILERANP